MRKYIADKESYVFDIEADGLYDDVTKIHCAVFENIHTKEVVTFTPDNIQEIIKFFSKIKCIIGHNIINYDLPVLKKILGIEFKGKIVDTLVMSRLLNPKRMIPFNAKDRRQGPHSLYAWGVRVGVDKPEHEDWTTFSKEMLHRCEEDVKINRKVLDILLEESEKDNWSDALKLSFRLFINLEKQERYGWKVDKPYMESLIETINRRLERIDKALMPRLPLITEPLEVKLKGEYNYVRKPFLKSGAYSKQTKDWLSKIQQEDIEIVGPFCRMETRPVDIESAQELKDYLLDLGWKPLAWNTNSEGERTSPKLNKDDTFEGVTAGIGSLLVRRVQYKQRRSIIEGLIQKIRPDGSISSVIIDLADTSRAKHRNIVNIPKAGALLGKQMRKMFTAREGKVLVSTDSDGNQLRQLAARMGDDDYIRAVSTGVKEEGTDIHTVNMKAAGLSSRDVAKTFIYGFLFGAGDAKIGSIIDGTKEEGKELREKFLKQIPALGNLLDKLEKEWVKTAKKKFNPKWGVYEYFDGNITGLDGRPIKVPFKHQLLVYLLQSDEAIHMTAAYNIANVLMEREGWEYGKDYGFVCFYHDEFTIECSPEIAERVKEISELAIKQAGEFYKIKCPHQGGGAIGNNWYEVH